jgi:hypothetical protein
MIYKTSIQNLLKEGIIKQCPVDFRAISKLMSRALVDLKTAERNLAEDEECAFTYAYNAVLRAGWLSCLVKDTGQKFQTNISRLSGLQHRY